MKTWMGILPCLLLAGCAVKEPQVIVITATAEPATATPTHVPPPPTSAFTPIPTSTPMPTPTPQPRWEPVEIGEIEGAFRADGYRRYPFTTGSGMTGFDWIKESAYESVTTWEDGSLELQVLHDESQDVRDEHMQRKLEVLDAVFPAGFMVELRRELAAYNRSVRFDLSGQPDDRIAYGDEWHTVWAQYYAEEIDIGSYTITFSVWWWQSTCPPQYWFCYYDDFPGLEFKGDSSFKFYTIMLDPTGVDVFSGPSS